MRLYLDNSVLNRPFDDPAQPRVWLEGLCTVLILQLAESGEASLVRSAIHDLENSRSPSSERKALVNFLLGLANETVPLTDAMRRRANTLRLDPMDALHVAVAESAGVDYFITCDDRLARRYHGRMRVLTPPEFALTYLKELP